MAAALSAHVAECSGIPLLLIKGPVLAEQGLRNPRGYADVDVWIPTHDSDAFVALLAKRGWHERGPNWFTDRVGSHSITLINDRWPCDIDVHFRFPGFLAPDEVVFGELWRTRSSMVLAGREVAVTGRASSAAILALHSIRQQWDRSKEYELEFLIEVVSEDDALIDEIVDVAAIGGASETLKPLFERLGATAKPGYLASDRELQEWHNRRAHRSRTGQWLGYLKSLPARKWPREFVIVVWPPTELFLQDHPGHQTTAAALFRGRVRRLLKGAAGVGHIIIARTRGRLGARPTAASIRVSE
ncbi:nucleotidyltransferase family protein [Herbiconiux sp. CPCC 205763]|uniref:Nucleotidyltransferase family protein n=1 Tax=Herbiconiux aconitum TaxID=2970913 RepID=A0ABT2GKM1_9MICO|nr:nucleotidyltransferase family protein [Herbiconiux aconitum]MCS5716767.1 nucleotidyltransferase family protein [Herbiconiux aconitum]